MEHTRAYFSDRFGIEATGFTVVVGENYEAMAPAYREVTSLDLSHAARQNQKGRTHGWVTYSPAGGAVVGLMYGHVAEWTLSNVKEIIAHEYFHVLQGQMASGFARMGSGEVAWGFQGNRGPTWLVEGLAIYADHMYTPTRPGRRSLLMRATPYEDLAWQRARDSEALVDDLAMELARIEDREAFHGCAVGWHSYALSFVAATFLVEEVAEEENAYVTYWKLLGERPTWQQAFEEAFGLSIEDFYTAFDEWINAWESPVPPMVQFKAQLRWPDQSTKGEGFPRFQLEEDHGTWVGTPINLVLRGSRADGTFYVIYPKDATGSGILSLWWTEDGCTEYLLGYYKDGGLTARREDATLVEFTGMPANIDWTIPGDPSTLLRLGCSGCDCAVSRSAAGDS